MIFLSIISLRLFFLQIKTWENSWNFMYFSVVNDAVMRFFGVKQCLNDVRMRHLENRLLEKCPSSLIFDLVWSWFFLSWTEKFWPKNMRFLNTVDFFSILRAERGIGVGQDPLTIALQQEEPVRSRKRSRVYQNEVNVQNLENASFNEWDWDF